jgi:hypothetical protein
MTPSDRLNNDERPGRIELDVDQLERIVCEVVRRLLAILNSGEQASIETLRASADLSMAEQVVTAMSLEGKLVGVARLVVQKHAVVTPSARDMLNDRRVELVREN